MNHPVRLAPFALILFAALSIPGVSAALTEQYKLQSSDSIFHDWFGYSVAVSGDTAIVGTLYGNGTVGGGRGAAYVFIRRGTSWFEQAKLVSSAGQGVDSFGWAVAISGNTAVVSAPTGHPQIPNTGAVHVFVRSGSSWYEQATLLAPDGFEMDGFGFSVAISGDTIAVGARSGNAAYIFVRSGSTWSLQSKLLGSDGAPYEAFGASVAITGDTLMVGATAYDVFHGAAYVFRRSGSIWSQQALLFASDRQPFNQFGSALAISGNTAVVGAAHGEIGGAYVFVESGSIWSEQAKLLPPVGQSWDMFGISVAISGDRVVVGARGRDDFAGAAYVFVRRGSSWTAQTELLPSVRNSYDYFGSSVAIADATALVGAYRADTWPNRLDVGAAYAFPAPGVMVAPSRLLTIEGGPASDWMVSLTTEPTGDVVIDLASSHPGEGTVLPAQLIFPLSDWSTPQTVTLTGMEDFVDDHGQPYTVSLLMNQELTGDGLYDGIDPEDVAAVNLAFDGGFYPVLPCRVLDTRQPDQQPFLTSGVERVVAFHGTCEVPTSARAVAVNVTVMQPAGRGYVALYPRDLPHPGPSTVTFLAGQGRSNNAVIPLATDGTGTLTAAPFVEFGGTVHLLIDLAGYFE